MNENDIEKGVYVIDASSGCIAVTHTPNLTHEHVNTGDFIRLSGNDCLKYGRTYVDVVVNGVFRNGMVYVDWASENGGYDLSEDTWPIEEFEPIPIDAEFLEKNGFEPIYSDKSAWKYKSVNESRELDSFIVIDLRHPSTCSVKNIKCKRSYEGCILYVHNLQHIMADCEIDKELIM